MTVEHFIQTIIAISSSYNFWPYWVPIIICLVGYTFVSVNEYHTDVQNRVNEAALPDDANISDYYKNKYTPKLKVGHLVGRFGVSFIPVVNLCLALFKFLPSLAKDIINACSKWLDIPLVPKNSPTKSK